MAASEPMGRHSEPSWSQARNPKPPKLPNPSFRGLRPHVPRHSPNSLLDSTSSFLTSSSFLKSSPKATNRARPPLPRIPRSPILLRAPRGRLFGWMPLAAIGLLAGTSAPEGLSMTPFSRQAEPSGRIDKSPPGRACVQRDCRSFGIPLRPFRASPLRWRIS
jgi:hypothetical protein